MGGVRVLVGTRKGAFKKRRDCGPARVLPVSADRVSGRMTMFQEFKAFIVRETKKWADLIKIAGIKGN